MPSLAKGLVGVIGTGRSLMELRGEKSLSADLRTAVGDDIEASKIQLGSINKPCWEFSRRATRLVKCSSRSWNPADHFDR